MLKQRIVCLCSGREHCEEMTADIAKRSNANGWFVEAIYAPLSSQLTYRGTIITKS